MDDGEGGERVGLGMQREEINILGQVEHPQAKKELKTGRQLSL